MATTLEGNFWKDDNVNEALEAVATASAVNHLQAVNAATGSPPKLKAAGDDTNVGLALEPKGTGLVQLNDGNGNEALKTESVAAAVNEVSVANAATGSPPAAKATGGDTNIDLLLTGKGTGGVRLGDTASDPIKKVDTGTTSLDPGSIAATSRGSVTFALTGANPGDLIHMQPPAALNDDLIFCGAEVTAADTVSVYLYNPTGGAIDDGAQTWRYIWIDLTP